MDDSSVSDIDLNAVKTKSGKSITDFTIPEALFEKDKELIKLIMESEAMNDSEKQYWFNLTKVMNDQQKDKLYDILRRERRKLNEIRGKSQPIDPEEARRKAEEQARQRAERQAEIEARERAHKEKSQEEEILDTIDW